MVKRIMIGLILVLLAACQSTPPVPTPIGPVTRPDLVPLINWERSPLAVVFRAESATVDTTSFERRSDIADCTIYGDNRVVYTAPGGIGTGVNWQRVNDEDIRLFVEDLMLNYQIYNQSSVIDSIPVEQRPSQSETLDLVVNGQAHRADIWGGWRDNYFSEVTERCRAVANAPVELLPAEAYVSAELTPYDDNRPSLIWEAGSGLDLAATTDRTWLSGPAMQTLWTAQRELGSDIQLRQGDSVYRVSVEVPGVTRYSPPPP